MKNETKSAGVEIVHPGALAKDISGFTLIEISVVLVIIALIVGGVLVGRDLIGAASVRAQIGQIEKYQQAVNTFRGKYGYLPGDIPEPDASTFGFIARSSIAGCTGQMGCGVGDGNGIIAGGSSYNPGAGLASGESAVFWRDLARAGLIEGSFTTAQFAFAASDVTGSGIDAYLPHAKIGTTSYVYAWSSGMFSPSYASTGINYLGVSVVTALQQYVGYQKPGTGGTPFTVAQAYAMDKKIDDGYPLTGNVLALFLYGPDSWWADGPSTASAYQNAPTQTASSVTSCFDNGNISGAREQYSVSYNNGIAVSYALSFQLK